MQEIQETRVRSLGWEDPLEEGMVTPEYHSSILAWRIPRPEEPGGYSPQGRKAIRLDCLGVCGSFVVTPPDTPRPQGLSDFLHS